MSVKYANTSGVKQLNPGSTQWLDIHGNPTTAPGHGILDKIATVAPYGIMAGFGYGALSDLGVLGAAGAGAGGASGAGAGASAAAAGGALAPTIPGSLASTAYGAGLFTAPAATGATMAGFGSGTLANYFSSPQGLSMLGQGGFNLAGALIQSHGNNKAAQMQAQAAQAALDFAKQQYAIQQQQNAPFLNASTGAVTRLTDLLNHPPQVQQAQYGNTVQPYAQQTGAAPQAVPATSGGQMVTLQSPDGKETQQFPSGDPRVAQYLAKGARRI